MKKQMSKKKKRTQYKTQKAHATRTLNK